MKTILAYVSVIVGVLAILLLLPIFLRNRVYGFGLLPAVIVAGGFGVLVLMGWVRRFLLLWGFVVGTVVGLSIPTDNVELSGLNAIIGAVIGVILCGFLDLIGPPDDNRPAADPS